MKKIIVMLALIAAIPAHAERWLEAANNAGGKIVLLPNDCGGTKQWNRAFATNPGMATIWGCWTLIAGEVHVIYDDSSRYSYPTNMFKYVDTDKK